MMVFELNLARQSCVISVNSNGLSTQPWGELVLSLMVLEVLFPILTCCGLSIRKSKTMLQREELKPGRDSILVRFFGMIVLKAELKSKMSILTDIGVHPIQLG